MEGLQFDIQIAGIDDSNVAKIYKEQEAKIQATLNKASKLDLPFKNTQIKALNEQLSKTKELLKAINSTKNIGTPLQRAKADIAYREAEAKATLNQKLASDKLLISQNNEILSAKRVETQNEKLVSAKLRTEAAQRRQTKATEAQNKAFTRQKGIMNGMPQFLNAYVSILGGIRLFENIKNITAEFELQRVSLRAITQEVAFADQLFEKIKMTAVESPFSTKDLITYTKQLSAYRIENEQLYGTMNKLADISAGLGVDMDRLILAYGQVKAASVLRGQELRQFTEAGIPLVAMLAEKFTELRGETVSTADVFELISKRAVSFEMVSEIFDDMTEAGGRFYNMQKIQAESLYGVFENLKDNIQIAFNEIGESNRGPLMWIGKEATMLAKNLEDIVKWLANAGLAWGSYRVVLAMATKSTVELGLAEQFEIGAQASQLRSRYAGIIGLKAATIASNIYAAAQARLALATNVVARSFWKLVAAMANNPIGIAVLAVVSLVAGIRKLTEASRESKKAYKEMVDTFAERTKSIDSYTRMLGDLNEMEKRGIDVGEKRAEILETLAEIDSDYAQTIKNKITDTEDLNRAEKEYIDTLNARLAIEREFIELGGMRLSKEYTKALENQSEALRRLNTNYGSNIEAIQSLMQSGKLTKESFDLLDNFLNGLNTDNYTTKLSELYDGLTRLARVGDLGKSTDTQILSALNFDGLSDYNLMTRIVQNTTEDFEDTFLSLIQTMKNESAVYSKTANLEKVWQDMKISPDDPQLKKSAADLENAIIAIFETALDSIGITGVARDRFAEIFGREFGFAFKKVELPGDALAAWQDTFNAYTANLQKNITNNLEKITDAETTRADILKTVTDAMKEQMEVLAQMERMDKSLVTEDELSKQRMWVKMLEDQYNYLGGLTETDGGSSDRTKALDDELSVLEDTFKKYQELRKFMSDPATKQKMAELGYAEIDEDIYINALESLKRKYEALGEDDKSIQIGIKIKDIAFDKLIENLENQLKNMSTQAEKQEAAQKFFEEVLGLTGDMEYAMRVTVNLTGMEVSNKNAKKIMNDNLLKALGELTADGGEVKVPTYLEVNGEIDIQKAQEWIDSLAEKDKEAAQNLLDNYAEFVQTIVKTNAEQINFLYDTLDKYSGYQRKREAIAAETEANIKKIMDTEYLRGDQAGLEQFEKDKSAAILALYQQLARDLGEVDFEILKSSDLWIKAFGDLDKVSSDTLDEMIAELKKYEGTAATTWDTTNIKEYVSTLEKLKEERLTRSLEWFDIMGGVPDNIQTAIKLQNELAAAEQWAATASQLQEMAAQNYLSKIEELTGQQLSLTQATDAYVESLIRQKGVQNGLTEDQIQDQINGVIRLKAAYQNASEVSGQAAANTSQLASALKQYSSSGKSAISTIDTIFTNIHNGMQAQDQLVQLLGNSKKNGTYALSKIQAAFTEFDGYVFSSWNKLKSGDIAGAIADLVTGVTKAFDSGLQMRQEKVIENIEKMSLEYQKLAASIDEAVGSERSLVTKEQLKNLERQIEAQKTIIRLEKQKRKSGDYDVIKQAEQDIATLKQDYQDAIDDLTEYFAGTSLASAAESFADSWLNAYVSFEDTKEALMGSVQDMIKNLVAKAVIAKAVEVALEPVFDRIEQTALGEGGFTSAKINDIIAMAEAIVPGLDLVLTKIMDEIDIARTGDTNLTGISKDIAGITEDTALALGGLGNSLLYYTVATSNNVAAIRTIMEARGDNTLTLNNLRDIAAESLNQLRAINMNTGRTADAVESVNRTLNSVTSTKGTASVKNLNTQIV